MSARSILISVILLLSVSSCREDQKQGGGPIILGDSSMIVTERDPGYLSDFVDDIHLQVIPADTAADTPDILQDSARAADTAAVPAEREQVRQPAAETDGLNIPFREVTVFIPGISVRSYREQNLQKANGASYELVSGALKNARLRVSGATITKVSQRYITNIIARNDMGTLHLDALSNTTGWTPLKGSGDTYTIAGLEPGKLNYKKATPAQIRAAVSRAARNKRMNRQTIRKWEASVRNIRSVDQEPLEVVLRSVMWKIEGKDASGKSFQKQVRIDLPV